MLNKLITITLFSLLIISKVDGQIIQDSINTLYKHLEIIEISEQKITTNSSQSNTLINEQKIRNESGKNLAEILTIISGVTMLKNGSGIAKPIIQGNFGNRISLVQNNMIFSNQNWGNDHAPEIDPQSADNLIVIKGVDAIEYGGNSLGGVVKVEHKKINFDPEFHGNANYFFNSNGISNGLNFKLINGWKEWLRFKLWGSFIISGDQNAPRYYLTNTGFKEISTGVNLQNTFKKIETKLFYSFYFKEVGILAGSQVGNLTDFENIINTTIPFNTKDYFSFDINAPKQEIIHHFFSINSKKEFKNNLTISFDYGFQINNRKEFDVLRLRAKNTPTLNLELYSHQTKINLTKAFNNKYNINIGLNSVYQNNSNNITIAVLPLIPNYSSINIGFYTIFNYNFKKWKFDIGGRYDYKNMEIIQLTELGLTLKNTKKIFNTYTLTGGINYEKHPYFVQKINIGYTLRSPEINELFSNGLHQGVAGIETGNEDLNVEKSLKINWNSNFTFKQIFNLETNLFYQHIEDYIYLGYTKENRLTIRGTFPVFKYFQDNSEIYGFDLMGNINITKSLNFILKYSIIRGRNINQNTSLIYMPQDQIFGKIQYSFKSGKKIESTKINMDGKYVFKQINYPKELELLSPPEGYFIMNTSIESSINIKNKLLKLNLNIENLLNSTYRDYLNRLRYFADEQGINVKLGIGFVF